MLRTPPTTEATPAWGTAPISLCSLSSFLYILSSYSLKLVNADKPKESITWIYLCWAGHHHEPTILSCRRAPARRATEMKFARWGVPGRIPCLPLSWFNVSSPAQAVGRIQECHSGVWHSKHESRVKNVWQGRQFMSKQNLFPAG